MNLSLKTDAQIDQWIANHEIKGQTDTPLYFQLLEERARRTQVMGGLNLEKSLDALRNAAIAGLCITYGDLAKASNVGWSTARHQMNGKYGHLDRLLEVCHARQFPLLTAICVNQTGLTTGELEKNALSGFIQGARRTGRIVIDELAFHQTCQRECWDWGKIQPPS
ncbi:hypothetical protein GOB07_09185 [Sinorhizobium meliloti]|nr:hypothetical protein [Sinorhizobium meliloti]